MIFGNAAAVGGVVLGPDLRGRYVEIYAENIAPGSVHDLKYALLQPFKALGIS